MLALDTDPAVRDTLYAACASALKTDGSEVVVLGCAGMAWLVPDLAARLGVPVVEGVAAATLEVAKLVRLGLRASNGGGFATPGAAGQPVAIQVPGSHVGSTT